MSTHTIVLISGKQGSGKTTLMDAMRNKYLEAGTIVRNVIFADTIYRIHDFAIKLLAERGIKRDIVKDGKLLQLLGTEWGRNTIDENIWVKCLLGEIEQIKKEYSEDAHIVFLVSDCRFRNEFDGLPEAFSVRLEAPRELRKARCSQWRDTDNHPSEIDLDGYARERKFNLYLDTSMDKEKTLRDLQDALVLWNLDKSVIGRGFSEVARRYYVSAN